MKLFDRLFRLEEINGGGRCPTYLYRWSLLRVPWFKVYLHHFVGDDWSLDLHDHPKRFISIGLWGWYREFTPDISSEVPKIRDYHAPWIRSFAATHIHRIATPGPGNVGNGSCWTLVIVLKTVREWGFWHSGVFMHWRDYVRGKDGIADKMKGC